MPNIVEALTGAVARYRVRRSIVRVGRLPPHLLQDMGFEPDEVYEARDRNDWRGIERAHR